jgi:hypothetical protein
MGTFSVGGDANLGTSYVLIEVTCTQRGHDDREKQGERRYGCAWMGLRSKVAVLLISQIRYRRACVILKLEA